MLLGAPLFGGTWLEGTGNAQSDLTSHDMVVLSWGRYLGTSLTAAKRTRVLHPIAPRGKSPSQPSTC